VVANEFCTQCGSKRAGTKFCGTCGLEFEFPQESNTETSQDDANAVPRQTSATETQTNTGFNPLFVFLGFLVIGGVVLLTLGTSGFFNASENQTSSSTPASPSSSPLTTANNTLDTVAACQMMKPALETKILVDGSADTKKNSLAQALSSVREAQRIYGGVLFTNLSFDPLVKSLSFVQTFLGEPGAEDIFRLGAVELYSSLNAVVEECYRVGVTITIRSPAE